MGCYKTRMGMKCKDLEASSKTGVQKIQFEVEPTTNEREGEDQTPIPDEIEGQ